MKGNLDVLADANALAEYTAQWMTGIASAKKGDIAIALSGGSTPKLLYQMLAEPPFLNIFPWQRVHWFWGDERFVPHDDPMSNYRMASDAMLAHAPVPLTHIHAVPTVGISPEQAAESYGQELKTFYGASQLDPARPLFDIILLGLGEDGHTASLFPGSPALEERVRWTAVSTLKGQARITLTYPALQSSAHTVFLVSGAAKRDILARVRGGDTALPAARLKPQGELRFFTDRDAAGCVS